MAAIAQPSSYMHVHITPRVSQACHVQAHACCLHIARPSHLCPAWPAGTRCPIS